MSCLAIVPARCGSKGVPRKNVRPLAGRPTIEYTLEVARACPEITKTVVTTDSEEIREIASRFAGVEAPFLRPAHLATDEARQEDAVLHALNWYAERDEFFDLVCLLEPTSPLRRAATLTRGFDLLRSRRDAEGVFSIAPCDFSPIYCSVPRPDGLLKGWIEDRYKWANRQELPDYYRLSALVVIARSETFLREQTFLHDGAVAMVVDVVEAVDVDSPLDFVLVERLLELGLGSSDDVAGYVQTD